MIVTGLYEILGVVQSASPDDIRKAYKKRALQTHPDRQSGATEEQKKASEEEFRKVNNAYEILNNPEQRREYDRHGQWPPPEPEDIYMHGPGSSHRNRHAGPFERERSFFPNPFHGGHHSGHYHRHHRSRHQPHPSFAFTDPFAFFDSFVEQLSRNDPFFAEFSPRPRSQPFVPAPAPAPFHFGGLFSQGGPSGFPAGFGPFSRPSIGPGRSWGSGVFSSSSFSSHSAPRDDSPGEYWTRESRTTRTINGVTESIWKRTDSNGNEHITRTFRDGTQKYTVNGMEQGPPAPNLANRALPSAYPSRGHDYIPRQHEYNPLPSYSGGSHTYHSSRS